MSTENRSFSSRTTNLRGSLEMILTAYNGQLIRQYGTTRLKCVHETTTHEAEFFDADTPGPVMFLRVQPYDFVITLQASRKANDAGRRHVKTTE